MDTDDRIRGLLGAMGLKQVVWNLLTNDSAIPRGNIPLVPNAWLIQNAVGLVANTLAIGINGTGMTFLPETNGYMSLEHETSYEDLQVAQQIIPMIKAKNFKFTTSAFCASGVDTDDEKYMNDSEPFVQFLNSIKLPLPGMARHKSFWLTVYGGLTGWMWVLVGCILFVGFLGFGIFLYLRKRQRNLPEESPSNEFNHPKNESKVSSNNDVNGYYNHHQNYHSNIQNQTSHNQYHSNIQNQTSYNQNQNNYPNYQQQHHINDDRSKHQQYSYQYNNQYPDI